MLYIFRLVFRILNHYSVGFIYPHVQLLLFYLGSYLLTIICFLKLSVMVSRIVLCGKKTATDHMLYDQPSFGICVSDLMVEPLIRKIVSFFYKGGGV